MEIFFAIVSILAFEFGLCLFCFVKKSAQSFIPQ
jgi:hypothetical protein